MNKSKFAIAMSLVIFSVSSIAHADCKDAYSNEIKRLDGMLNPARATVAGSGAAAIVLPVTLTALGLTVAPAAVIAAPATAGVVGIFYAAVEGRKAALRKALMLIKNSEKGDGKYLNKFTVHLQNKVDASITKNDVITTVKALNQSNAFCPESDRGKVHLSGYLKAKAKVKNALISSGAGTAQLDQLDIEELSAESQDNTTI